MVVAGCYLSLQSTLATTDCVAANAALLTPLDPAVDPPLLLLNMVSIYPMSVVLDAVQIVSSTCALLVSSIYYQTIQYGQHPYTSRDRLVRGDSSTILA